MNINSQFYITNYTGKEPLDLMTKPVSFTESNQIADYNRFIEAVSTIYASQNATGGIPVFWTQRNTSTDPIDGIKYTYSPSDKSTLQALQPKESYYFILRDPSYVPLKVPTVGGSLPGFPEEDMLPIVKTPNSPVTLTAVSGNKYLCSIKIDELQSYSTYEYKVNSIFANWPITVSPESGILKPSGKNTSIDLSIIFCGSTGLCPSGTMGLIDYSIDNNLTNVISNSIPESMRTTLQIAVSPVSYSGIEILSDQFTVECKDCLPKIKIDIPSEPVTLNKEHGHCYDLVANLNGLVPYKEYSYVFASTSANWPAVITPISGIYRSSKNTGIIRSRLSFCPSVSVCASGTDGLIDYDLNSYYPLFDTSCGKFVTLELTMSAIDGSMSESISDKATIYCVDCFEYPVKNINITNS